MKYSKKCYGVQYTTKGRISGDFMINAALVSYSPNGDKIIASDWEFVSILASKHTFAYRRIEKNGKFSNYQYSPFFEDFSKLLDWIEVGQAIPVERAEPKNSVHVHLP